LRQCLFRETLVVLAFLSLAVAFFWPVIFGGSVLLPVDNLFQWLPWKAFSAQFGTTVPQNHLLSDLILENYPWKEFIVGSLRSGELPLWNPYLFAGVPFLAAGQSSALYPLSALFYLLPVARAYGLFVVLNLALAATFMYLYLRVLGVGRLGGIIAGIVYAFSGFMLVSVAHVMIVSVAAWLPLVLAMAELIVREEESRATSRRTLLWIVGGDVALGLQFLAGHVELSYFVLLTLGFYSACRLVALWLARRRLRSLLVTVLALGSMVLLGVGLGAVQLAPLYELVSQSFRQGSVGYSDVVGWALPPKRAITFLVPDFFGNPSIHSYFDLFSGRVQPVTRNFLGEAVTTINEVPWGVKNYVESGSYLGLLPLLLCLVALLGRRTRYTWIMASLAALSLLFAFGTPVYALLFYLLPGYGQSHSPFRWIFPYTLSLAVLAGMGADYLARSREGRAASRWLGWLAFGAGASVVLGLIGSLFCKQQMAGLAEALIRRSQGMQQVFSGGQMFYSWEFRNLLVFGLFLAGAGAVLVLSRRPVYLPQRLGHLPLWQPLAAGVIALDLLVFSWGFNPRGDPRLLDFVPPAVQFLKQDQTAFRVATVDQPGEKLFNPNALMPYGISDIRGYDSIIPRQYVEYMSLIADQTELLYNRIAPFYWQGVLDSPLVDLLGVKYVATTAPIKLPQYELVYDGEVKIYRNNRALPRAFVVYQAQVVPDPKQLGERLRRLDPRQVVLLDSAPPGGTEELPGNASGFFASEDAQPGREVSDLQYGRNRVALTVSLPRPGYLVLTDSYFPGWQAQVDGKEVAIYRADLNFRALYLGSGQHTVVFKYSPLSFKLGLFVSFLSGVVVLMGLAVWTWRRFYREEEGDYELRRVVKNSVIPMATSLLNKAMDFAFAMLMLRLLGPIGSGRLGYAVNLWLFLSIVTDFGLGTLTTREVAKDRSRANRYLTNTAVVRLGLSLFSLLPVLAVLLLNRSLTGDTVAAIALLWVSLAPGGIAASLSYLFNAYERFEYPALITVIAKLTSTFLGVVVLLFGGGIVGLAAVSLLVNLLTAGILYALVRHSLFVPRWEYQPDLVRSMLKDSYPLMLNNLLSTIFFRVDVQLLQPLKGDAVVGYYNAAYRYIDGLNIIPSNFTLAIFPMLSRYAASGKEAMLRAYVLSLRYLVLVALPLAVGMAAVARELVLLLGGSQFLPHSMIAMQLLIWFLPFSFINSVTQYVLIALNQQRFLTLAFAMGVAFNIIANTIFIPIYSYQAAAVITVLSEIVLLVPFYYSVRMNLAPVPWLAILWRPAAAAALMGGSFWWLARLMPSLAALPVAAVVYVLALVALGSFTKEDIDLARKLIRRPTYVTSEEI